LGERSGAPSGSRPSSFVMCNTPVEVQLPQPGRIILLHYLLSFYNSIEIEWIIFLTAAVLLATRSVP
jgi:hypothetical protein